MNTFELLIELLREDGQGAIAIELKEAQKHVNGLTDGWYEFLYAFKKLIIANSNQMTTRQNEIAESLITTLSKMLSNRYLKL